MKWEINVEVGTEGIVALNLIEKINYLYRAIAEGRIIIHIDNKMVLKI